MVSPVLESHKPPSMKDKDPLVNDDRSEDGPRRTWFSERTKTTLLVVLLLALVLQCCLFLAVILTASQSCMDEVRATVEKIECYFEGCNNTWEMANDTLEVTETTLTTSTSSPSLSGPPATRNLGRDGHGRRREVPASSTDDFRMVRHALPVHYEIHLSNYIEEGRFEGKVNILLNIVEKKDFILLHIGPQLTVKNVTLHTEGDTDHIDVIWSTENRNEFLYIKPSSPMEKGLQYIVGVEYVGEYTESLKGVYRSFYFNQQKPSFVVSTHFEPTYARMLFPCFDEPEYKATFDFSIEEDKEYKILFNTPVKTKQAVSHTRTKYTFTTTPKMSPYLLAFVVCQYGSLNKKTNRGVLVRVHAPKHLLQQTRDALKYAVKAIEFLEQYLNSTYDLSKLDLVYIPDFGVAGMENWGLILLNGMTMFTSRSSSTGQKLQVARTVIHEVAHQWFGNLVTAQWWSDLWLHEGFSTFYSYLVAQRVEPSWNSFEYFSFGVQCAMRHEDRNRSRGLSSEVTTKRQVRKVFNHVTYSKGAAVLRMFHEALGENVMQKSIADYISSYSGQSVRTDHFIESMRAAMQKSNKQELLTQWTSTNSYPIIHVTLTGTDVDFKQEKYISRHEDQLWFVPIQCVTSRGEFVAFDLKDKQKSIKLKKAAEWIKCNKDHKGYYRVNYDEDTWNKLTEIDLPNPFISNSDIANLIDDSFTLAFNMEVSIDVPLLFMLSIRNVNSLVVWKTAIQNYRRLWYHFEFSEPTYEHLRVLGKNILFPVYRRLSTLTEDVDQRMLRRYVFDFATELEFWSALWQSTHSFDHWLEGDKIPGDHRATIISQGVKWGSRNVFFQAFSKYLDSNDDVEQTDILYGLAASRDENLLYQLLQYTEKPGVIKRQNLMFVFLSVARSYVGRRVLWRYIIDLIFKSLERSDSGGLMSNDVINSGMFDEILEHATSELEINEMKESLKASSLGSTQEGSLLAEYLDSLNSLTQLGEMAQEQISKLVSRQSLAEVMKEDQLSALESSVRSRLTSLLNL